MGVKCNCFIHTAADRNLRGVNLEKKFHNTSENATKIRTIRLFKV